LPIKVTLLSPSFIVSFPPQCGLRARDSTPASPSRKARLAARRGVDAPHGRVFGRGRTRLRAPQRFSAMLGCVAKVRADLLLVERGLAAGRERARALILAGRVFSGERRVDKAGEALVRDAPLHVRG